MLVMDSFSPYVLLPIERVNPAAQLLQRVGVDVLMAARDLAEGHGQFVLDQLVAGLANSGGARVLLAGHDEEAETLIGDVVFRLTVVGGTGRRHPADQTAGVEAEIEG